MDMDKSERMTLRESVDESISVAVKRGVLDIEANAAPIALLRRMADTLDANDDPLTLRYCTPASFTALLEKLGLMPTEQQLERATPKREGSYSRLIQSPRIQKIREGYARSNGMLDTSELPNETDSLSA